MDTVLTRQRSCILLKTRVLDCESNCTVQRHYLFVPLRCLTKQGRGGVCGAKDDEIEVTSKYCIFTHVCVIHYQQHTAHCTSHHSSLFRVCHLTTPFLQRCTVYAGSHLENQCLPFEHMGHNLMHSFPTSAERSYCHLFKESLQIMYI